MARTLVCALACALGALALAPAALAQDVTLGGAAQAGVGHVRLVSDVSDATTANDASWISLRVPGGLRFADIDTLSAEFNVTDDDCGGGSPRFEIEIGGKNVFVYLGPSPSFTGCPQNTWLASGNLVGTSDACRVDTSQFQPGTQCTTWAAAVALLGSHRVSAARVVVDGGWFFAPPRTQTDREQTVLVRNVRLNRLTVITPQELKRQNPAHLCTAERASLGAAAFNKLWGANVNDRNAFGKCVSFMAKARTAGAAHEAIMAAVRACKERGLHGAALGACVSERDGVDATRADPAHGGKGPRKGRRR
ncbi:MAG TPA: hypothetical protein VNJ46_06490 [Gaiellaceae bacterium]|nr:hypothetical protein [Gaiellaceae bacterium]